MSDRLLRALGGSRTEIVRALRATHRDLVRLREQVRELELQAAQARIILDLAGTWIPWPPLPGPSRPITLHQAMATVLADSGARWMTTRHVAQEVARRGLYRRRDGLPPSVRDVSARVSTYPALFVRQDELVRLRQPGAGQPV